MHETSTKELEVYRLVTDKLAFPWFTLLSEKVMDRLGTVEHEVYRTKKLQV